MSSCRSAYWHSYYVAHKEEKADYYAAFREKICERQKEYDAAHKEEKMAYNKAYYAAHKKEVAERKRRYRQAHREQITEKNRRYRQEHREQINARRRELRAERKAALAKEEKWVSEYKDECKALDEDTEDCGVCVYGCDDCFYFGEEYEGAFYCAFDTEHTHPMDIDANCMCFMKRGGLKRWRSMFDKPRRNAGI